MILSHTPALRSRRKDVQPLHRRRKLGRTPFPPPQTSRTFQTKYFVERWRRRCNGHNVLNDWLLLPRPTSTFLRKKRGKKAIKCDLSCCKRATPKLISSSWKNISSAQRRLWIRSDLDLATLAHGRFLVCNVNPLCVAYKRAKLVRRGGGRATVVLWRDRNVHHVYTCTHKISRDTAVAQAAAQIHGWLTTTPSRVLLFEGGQASWRSKSMPESCLGHIERNTTAKIMTRPAKVSGRPRN